MAARLNPDILNTLHEKTGLAVSTLRSYISRTKQTYPALTSNAAAHLVAQEYKTSVLQKLDQEDRDSLNNIQMMASLDKLAKAKPAVKEKTKKKANKHKSIIDYDSKNYFVKEHIAELSRAYYAKCYTSVFILFRKIIENFIIDILKAKFPSNHELVYNNALHRYHDFSVVLENLYDHRNDFSHEGKVAIKRLNQLVKPFKKDANDKTHSWFHIVKSQQEVDNLQLEPIIELIKFLEKEEDIR